MNREKLAYNIDPYKGKSRQTLVADVSSLVLETAGITPYILCATPCGAVISPAYGDIDIAKSFKLEKPIDSLEKEATLKIKEIILSEEKPFVLVWISPPDEAAGYKEGRLQVGFGQKKESLNVVVNYGIRIAWSTDNCLTIGNRLLTLSGNQPVGSIDELRAQPISLELPAGENPIDFIAQEIDLPEVWQKIRSGETKIMQEKAVADANKVIEGLYKRIQKARTTEEQRAIGTEIVEGMRDSGHDVSKDDCPGSFYSDSITPYASFSYQVGESGSVNLINSELGVFCKECPFCHRQINAVIYPGYKCNCGQVFTGGCGGETRSTSTKATADNQEEENNPIVGLIGLLFSFIFGF